MPNGEIRDIRGLVVAALCLLAVCLVVLIYVVTAIHASERVTNDRLQRIEKKVDEAWQVQQMAEGHFRGELKRIEAMCQEE